MAVKTNAPGITFAVHDVEAVRTKLRTWKTRDGIKALLEVEEERETTPVLYCSGYNSDTIHNLSYCPLLAAVHLAFSDHRPLTLSPDMIWVTIMQGFAQHVKNNADELRDLLVDHEGKLTIAIRRDDLSPDSPESAWDSVADDLYQALDAHLYGKYSGLISDFSTTGDVERIVCEIALLDVFEPYFEYVVYCICGIPEITLEGTPSDWQKLRDKVELLAPYKMDNWLRHLRDIAEHFYRASNGDVDLAHWQNIYKRRDAYGWDSINGWIVKLIPYVKCAQTGKYCIENPLLLEEYGDVWQETPEKPWMNGQGGIQTKVLPPGLAQVPFKIVTPAGEKKMQFLGGFVGVEQDETSGAIKPKLGWAVREASAPHCPLLGLLEQLPPGITRVPALPAGRLTALVNSWWEKRLSGTIPFAVVSFYMHCDGLESGNANSKEWWRLRSFADFEVVPEPVIVGRTAPENSWDAPAPEGVSPQEWAEMMKVEKQRNTPHWVRFFDRADGIYGMFCLQHFTHNEPVDILIVNPIDGKADRVASSFEQFVTFLVAGEQRS
jgi:hypothetical protein